MFLLSFKNGGGDIPPPHSQTLERSWNTATVHFVRFYAMAGTAELRRLVRARCSRIRVIGPANEEHRRVIASGLTGIAGAHRYDVHLVLVMATGAHNRGLVVIGKRANEDSIVCL